jgi:Lar family restriction alleviation protein
MTDELKACPFCGSDKIHLVAGMGYYVKCLGCGQDTNICDYAKEAVTVWNTRPIEDALRKEIEELKMTEELKANRWGEIRTRLIKDFATDDLIEFSAHANAWAAYIAKKEEELDALRKEIEELKMTLKKISEGVGAFSRDPLTHVFNCIENMKDIVLKALEVKP